MSSSGGAQSDPDKVSDADSVDQNRATVLRLFEGVINGRDLSLVDDICSDDCVVHVPGLQLSPGPDGLREFAQSLHTGFPDLHVVVDDMIATEDGVAVRWHTDRQTHTGEYRGLPPTGRPVTVTGTNFYRLTSGLIRRAWIQADSLGLAQQLGIVPPDGLGPAANVRFVLGSVVRIGYLQARHSARARSDRKTLNRAGMDPESYDSEPEGPTTSTED